MVLPIRDEALQQVGAAQERALRRRRSAEGHVVAAAGAGVPPVEHEFLGAEPRLARLLVQRLDRRGELGPRSSRMDVHLDDAGIGRHVEHPDARIARRRIAFDRDGHLYLARGRFDDGKQHDVILGPGKRRHEDVQVTVAHLARRAPS